MERLLMLGKISQQIPHTGNQRYFFEGTITLRVIKIICFS
ncbi:hypothetical protein ECTW09195_5892 [Escherichia coli TW09195]|nr:hypothetical protein ECFRIK1990_2907 [Escherichia coli FRIK1990]EIO84218.1 hypothetical protein ECTW09195_5892 [Escherichia coli TW09195]EKJ10032.1 hypothetical protein ECEC1862_2675 [Escherichia coli EC1862]KDX17750.1 hypothetical protein AC45_4629 [Escherichia coli 2-210-07_S3_C3]KDX18027.1 hypothetical protein AC45_4360 [Escherichia coli 2-210-07_S3_C3]